MNKETEAGFGAVGAPVEPSVRQRAWADQAAFPIPLDNRPGAYQAEPGMGLRDYFAAKAMQGLLAQSMGTAFGSLPADAAEYAYRVADAMMAARVA